MEYTEYDALMDRVYSQVDANRLQRIKAGKPLKAPSGCRPGCHDETDCSNVLTCQSIAAVYEEAT